MRRLLKPLERLKGLSGAVGRYPFTAAFLLLAAAVLAVSIHADQNQEQMLWSCAVGAVLCAASQVAFERFFRRQTVRLLLSGGSALLALGYYLIVRLAPEMSMETAVRTSVALLALFFAYIWLPSIRSTTIGFSESFMASFKAFFHSLLYAAVLFGGCSLIIAAIDNLITPLSSKAYAYTADFIFVLFAPLFLLSLIPIYPGESGKDAPPEETAARDERVRKAIFCPRFLEVLLSYIVIPLTAVFTVILVLYIVLNIQGPFWTDNLLEPLLISYAVAVIMVTVLSGKLENRFANYFRRIFPKVLIPIVAFQIVASALTLRDAGVTHTRYFVILFGVFAICSGLVLSFFPVGKYGYVAALLIGFSVVSVVPPMDAFSVSYRSQVHLLGSVLEQNGMLVDSAVIPNGTIPDADKQKIVSSVEYLDRMGYLVKIPWLPEGFQTYDDFYEIFGFHPYDLPKNNNRWVSVALNQELPVDVSGYDVLVRTTLSGETPQGTVCEIAHAGAGYVLAREQAEGVPDLVLTEASGLEVIRFHTADLYARYMDYTGDWLQLSVEEATFSQKNERAELTVIVQNANMQSDGTTGGISYEYADLLILIRFK